MSQNTDLFAPPSAEEMKQYRTDVFAPPTKEELYKVQKPEQRGVQVYDKPAGPEQASVVDRFVERVQDPQRWQAILAGKGPQAPKVVQGDVPLVMPGGAIPKLAKAATALAEGKGLAYMAGRTALSAGQGAVMSAADGKDGESWQDKIDRTTSGAKLSGGIQLVAESIPVVGKALGYAGRKLGSAISGVDESIIQNYANRTDEVNGLIKQSGGDITAAADQVRSELSAGIQNTKSKLNAQISSTLENASPEATIPIQPLIDKLQAAKSKLNPNFKSGAIAEIDEMMASIGKEAKDGKISVKGLYDIKQYLNDTASSSFLRPGQIFQGSSGMHGPSKEAARAAKDAVAEARGLVRTHASDIATADAEIAKLHSIEMRLNKNILAAGKPDAALIAAGSGANPRNAANLRALEDVSGVPVAQRAKDVATARTFANPSMVPSDFTGKSLTRMAAGIGIGSAVGSQNDSTGTGALVGGMIASPMGMKLGINALSVARDVAARFPSFAKFTRENPIAAQTVAQLVAGQLRRANEKPTDIAPDVEQYFRENPKLMQDVRDPKTRADLERRVAPKAGPDRWAQGGLERLGIQDRALADKLLNSKEGKQLLIEASDLHPESQAMKRIKDKIQKGWGYNGNEPGSSASSEVLRRERKPSSRR